MIKTIDELMYINDGHLPYLININGKGGLGYKPTPYNIIGRSIRNNEYIAYDKSELDKMSEDELLKSLEQNYNFFDIAGEDEELNQRQKFIKKEIENETSYIEKLLDKKYTKDLQEEQEYIDEEKQDREELKNYLKNINNLSLDNLVELSSLLIKMNVEGNLSDEKEEEISNLIRKREQELLQIKHLDENIKYNLKKYDTNDDIENKLITGIKNGKWYYEDEEVINPDEMTKLVKSIKVNEGDGKKFEKVIINIQDKIQKKLTKDKSELTNNENIMRYKNKKVYFPEEKDKNGKVIKWKEKPLSEFLIFDLSQKHNDIELKYYNVGTYRPDENEIIKNGIYLQEAKFMNTNFIPLYTKNENGETKLYNIWSVKTNDYVNNDYMKDVYVLYQTPSGNFSYKINDDKDLKEIDYPLKGKNGEKLFVLKPNYKNGFDNHGKSIYQIPYKKLKKIYL